MKKQRSEDFKMQFPHRAKWLAKFTKKFCSWGIRRIKYTENRDSKGIYKNINQELLLHCGSTQQGDFIKFSLYYA